jgi:tRNA threonylcarbamoyladenosine biosynthesis protein TsaB
MAQGRHAVQYGYRLLHPTECGLRVQATEVEFPDLTGVGVGSGWGVYRQELMTRLAGRVSYCEIDNLPRAGAIARLGVRGFEQGLAVTVEQAMPVYLRDKVAKKESER